MNNVVEIKNFTKVYRKNIKAVSNLNLKVPLGSFFGLIGPNGAGKSTIIHFITGLIKPTMGELFLFGRKIKTDDFSYKKKVGVVLHKPSFLNKLTGKEYLQFVGQINGLEKTTIEKRTQELLELFELPAKGKKYIDSYSAGMQKKISLAAALIHDPDLLILDEPFAGIDPISFKLITENLKLFIQRRKTILLTSHVLDVVEKLCDEVAIIHKGKLTFHGKIEDAQDTFQNENDLNKYSDLESLFHSLIGTEPKKTLSWIENRKN
ncbi:MAG: ABC transporter ATP-binding protein [Candidatus Helarchaeota archaeon]